MKRELFPTQQMQGEVAKFYAEIFLLLSDVMSWVTRKRRERLLDSFKEDFNKRFEDQVEKITAISEKMRTLAALGTSAEQRVMRLNMEKIGSEIQDIRTGLEGDSRDRAEQTHRLERLERELSDLKAAVRDEGHIFKQLASDVKLLLRGQALQYISSQPPERRVRLHSYQRTKLTKEPQTDTYYLPARSLSRKASLSQHRRPNVSPPIVPTSPHLH